MKSGGKRGGMRQAQKCKAQQFPREPVTRARYLPPSPYLFFSAKAVDHGYFVSKATAALSMSESILCAAVSATVARPLTSTCKECFTTRLVCCE